jgi:hypothetical protein
MSRRAISTWDADAGLALIVVLMAIGLLMALGTALVLTSMTETTIASTYRDGVEARYAAEAAAALAIRALAAQPDWDAVLDGRVRSPFTDGVPGGRRGIDLATETNLVRCGKPTPCTPADLDRVTSQRPWGRNNPRWQLYVHTRLVDVMPAPAAESPIYVVVWIGDDPSESDDNPLRDSEGDDAGDGKNIVTVLARAYGPRAVVQGIIATYSRAGIVSWRAAAERP